MDLVCPFDRFIFVADDHRPRIVTNFRRTPSDTNWAIGRSLLRSQAARSGFLRYCVARDGPVK